MPSRDHPTLEMDSILAEWSSQDRQTLDSLLPSVIDDLRRLAHHYFQREDPGHILQPTALVNEVYVRLRESRLTGFENRRQFLSFASRLIRQILVDHARERRAEKRGGGLRPGPLEEARAAPATTNLDAETLIALDEALESLERIDARQVRIVELRYFAGLSQPEVAKTLGISLATVERGWSAARCSLARALGRRASARGGPA